MTDKFDFIESRNLDCGFLVFIVEVKKPRILQE